MNRHLKITNSKGHISWLTHFLPHIQGKKRAITRSCALVDSLSNWSGARRLAWMTDLLSVLMCKSLKNATVHECLMSLFLFPTCVALSGINLGAVSHAVMMLWHMCVTHQPVKQLNLNATCLICLNNLHVKRVYFTTLSCSQCGGGGGSGGTLLSSLSNTRNQWNNWSALAAQAVSKLPHCIISLVCVRVVESLSSRRSLARWFQPGGGWVSCSLDIIGCKDGQLHSTTMVQWYEKNAVKRLNHG